MSTRICWMLLSRRSSLWRVYRRQSAARSGGLNWERRNGKERRNNPNRLWRMPLTDLWGISLSVTSHYSGSLCDFFFVFNINVLIYTQQYWLNSPLITFALARYSKRALGSVRSAAVRFVDLKSGIIIFVLFFILLGVRSTIKHNVPGKVNN